MAYALMLKQVGILHQTIYLVATAMRLSLCTLEGGNFDFIKAVGCDYYVETSVEEFVFCFRQLVKSWVSYARYIN